MNEIVKERLKKIEEELKILQQPEDTERAHGIADNYLCEALTLLGYKKIAEEYEKIDKWYA